MPFITYYYMISSLAVILNNYNESTTQKSNFI